MNRWGLTWKVPLSTIPHLHAGQEIDVPYLSPLKFLPHLMQRAPHLLFGGLGLVEGQKLLKCFWTTYKQTHEQHPVFKDGNDLSTTLPLALHGDEGRGVRKGNTCLLTLESPFGLGTKSNLDNLQHRFGCKCCGCSGVDLARPVLGSDKLPGDTAIPLEAFMDHNTRGHSFLTKFLVFLLPHALYKEGDLLDRLLDQICKELRQLFYEGFWAQGKYIGRWD